MFHVRSLMFPVKLGSVIAATTPIIVRDNRISAIVKALVIARAVARGDPVNHWCVLNEIATSFASLTPRNDGTFFIVIPNLFRDLANVNDSPQRRIDPESRSLRSLFRMTFTYSHGSHCGCRSAVGSAFTLMFFVVQSLGTKYGTGSAGPPPPCFNGYTSIFHIFFILSPGTLPGLFVGQAQPAIWL